MATTMEYYSFERVLKELQIEEDELKRLVSEGEIRAFRDEDKMKFKKSDIEGLKKGRMTEPTIILPSGEPDDSSEDSEVLLVEEDTSETLLDIDDLEGAESSSMSVPTVDFSSSEFEDSSSGSGTITEELTFEEDSGSYVLESSDDVLIDSSQELQPIDDASDPQETFVDSDTGLQTEPLDLDESGDVSSYPSLDSEMDIDEQDTGMATAPVADEPPRATHTHRVPVTVIEEPISNSMLVCLVLTCGILLFSGILMINTLKQIDTPVTGWLTDVSSQFFPPKYVGSSESKIKSHLKWRSKTRENPGRARAGR